MKQPHLQNSPKETISQFVEFFNNKDIAGLIGLYHDDVINHRLASGPVRGKEPIIAMFERVFEKSEMICRMENTFGDGECSILEWWDTRGLQGGAFVYVIDGKIKYQCLYSDMRFFLW